MAKKSVHLPEELIIEILLRLPVKTLLQFKCVCKSWLSLISHPDFATSHFQLAASPTHKLVFLGNYSETLSIDFNASLNSDSSYASLNLDFMRLHSRFEIRGSCRGFLLLQCDDYFYVLNPSTRVHKQIPPSPIAYSFNLLTFLYGFGYDPSTNDYLVVFGSCKSNYFNDPVDSSIGLLIFSLRADRWKQIAPGSSLPYTITAQCGYAHKDGLLFNEAIHWMVYNHETSRDVVIAFDLKEMTMSEIALPDDFILNISNSDDYFIEYDLLVFGGLISAWNVDMYTIEIWVMREYNVHSSWTKTLNFSFYPSLDFSPLCFTKNGEIVGRVHGGGLEKFNDKGHMLEHHSYGNFYFLTSQLAVYTESLLSLPGGTEQAYEDD